MYFILFLWSSSVRMVAIFADMTQKIVGMTHLFSEITNGLMEFIVPLLRTNQQKIKFI